MLSLLFLSFATAEDSELFQSRTFVIAASEKSFSQAIQKAVTLSEKTGLRFDMRGVGFEPKHRNDHGGLTFTKTECEENGWDYPCYLPRGRWDSGEYISIEHTSAIQGFTPGLYVVIASTGTTAEVAPTLEKVKKVIPDAYTKTSQVYVGCMH